MYTETIGPEIRSQLDLKINNSLTCARPVGSYKLAPTKIKFGFFRDKRRFVDDWRDIGPIQKDQIIARPNLYNIL